MTAEAPRGAVIVGVHPDQCVAVVLEAARLADALERPLVCAYVTEDSYLTEWDRADVREEASLHPADVASAEEGIARELAAAIATALAPSGGRPQPAWTLRILAGDPGKALARIGAELDARLLVVGTRGRGVEPALEEWLGGSVAAHLARDQVRPVVVVPTHGVIGERLAPPR
ncbi:universal stress protein [Leifsonia shinshuensis]|uniref:universal stress protein n=1 Tax=Leifsonia shinshuensis TaxID=150026 RepID=UPI001F514306|nr:universal stress protein [Leifsonia shinshuensis]MCI0155429.1 universal stress protein [Leifsonia shinshuensis]